MCAVCQGWVQSGHIRQISFKELFCYFSRLSIFGISMSCFDVIPGSNIHHLCTISISPRYGHFLLHCLYILFVARYIPGQSNEVVDRDGHLLLTSNS